MLAPWNRFKPSKIFYWPFQGGTSFVDHYCVIYVLCVSWIRVCLLLPCGHLLGKGRPIGSCVWCLIVFLSLSHVVSWVRCGTWLHRFLIFAAFLTLIPTCLYGRTKTSLKTAGCIKFYTITVSSDETTRTHDSWDATLLVKLHTCTYCFGSYSSINMSARWTNFTVDRNENQMHNQTTRNFFFRGGGGGGGVAVVVCVFVVLGFFSWFLISRFRLVAIINEAHAWWPPTAIFCWRVGSKIATERN